MGMKYIAQLGELVESSLQVEGACWGVCTAAASRPTVLKEDDLLLLLAY
jgi:hypothetical protein